MEVTGRVASENILCSLNRNNGDNGGSGNDNISIVRQTSDRGYEGSSEDTQRQSVNVPCERRRSHSLQYHAQQFGRSGTRHGLSPMYRGKRWRRRLMRKQESAERKSQQQQQKQHDLNEMQSDKIMKTCITNGDIKLTFQVQLAHGSPTGIIRGFNNITELYQAIANCYDEITMDDILFCTINTHRISMDALLCSNININDFIFAHVAGQKKEVTLIKTEAALGLTITDNGAGKAFIKRIVPGTITSKAKPAVEIGDFIEKINGKSMVGQKHFDVARCLRTLPVGSVFTMRLVGPKRTGFNFIASYSMPKCMRSILGVNETIRFKADGTIVIQEMPNTLIINKMNDIFDSYFGFHDNDLAQTIWEMITSCENFNDLKNVLKKSDISDFNFPTELYFDLWGMVDDYRNGRFGKIDMSLKKTAIDGELLSDE